MRRVAVAVAALVSALAVAPAAVAATCTSAIQDPAGVLAASSRLDGAVAALERLDIGVRVSVDHDAVVPPAQPGCPAPSAEHAGMVFVDLQGQPPEAHVGGEGSVSPALAQRAQRVMRSRLGIDAPDTASAVAQGLELVWQAQDRRESQPVEQYAEAAPRPVRSLPPAGLVHVLNRVFAGVVVVGGMAAGVVAAAVAGARVRARRRALSRLRYAALAVRRDLAERYVDLDTRVATIVTNIDHAAGSAKGMATTTALAEIAGRRKAAVEAAAVQAGAALLSTSRTLTRVSAAEAKEVAARCGAALDALEEAVALLSQSPAEAAARGLSSTERPLRPREASTPSPLGRSHGVRGDLAV